MQKLQGRQMISRIWFESTVGVCDLSKTVVHMFVRERGVGPEAKEVEIGRFKVKSLKPKAFEVNSFIPGTYKKFNE